MHLQALCVNESVLKLGAGTRINEKCLEMLQAKSTKKQAIGVSSNRSKVSCTANGTHCLTGLQNTMLHATYIHCFCIVVDEGLRRC